MSVVSESESRDIDPQRASRTKAVWDRPLPTIGGSAMLAEDIERMKEMVRGQRAAIRNLMTFVDRLEKDLDKLSDSSA